MKNKGVLGVFVRTLDTYIRYTVPILRESSLLSTRTPKTNGNPNETLQPVHVRQGYLAMRAGGVRRILVGDNERVLFRLTRGAVGSNADQLYLIVPGSKDVG